MPSPAVKRRKTTYTPLTGPVQEAYEAWLAERGASHPRLAFGVSPLGGVGLFAREEIAAGAELLSTPAGLAVSEAVASRWWCSLGLAPPVSTAEAEQQGGDDASSSPVVDTAAALYAFLVVGRHTEGPVGEAAAAAPSPHFWGPYLCALPETYSDPSWWPRLAGGDRCLELVRGTTLGQQVARRERGLRRRHGALTDALASVGATGESAALTWGRMIWAQSTVLSRAFPAALGDGPVAIVDPRDGAQYQQTLLPLHDALNYQPGIPTVWRTDARLKRIDFSVRAAVPEGAEALINYGTKSNEDLLLHYGFTLAKGASPDTVSLELSLPAEGQTALLQRAGLSTSLKLGGGDSSGAAPDEIVPDLDDMLAVMRVASLADENVAQLQNAPPKALRATLTARLSDEHTELSALNALCRTLNSKFGAVETTLVEGRAAAAQPLVKEGSDLAFAWSNALQYVQGQRDVLGRAADAALQLYSAEITTTVGSTEAVPGSNAICCAEAVGANASVRTFPLAECITVADARGSAKEAGQGFQDAIQKVEGSIDDETATLLFILAAAAAAAPEVRWHSLWSALPEPTALDEGDPMVAELQEIHAALFPALTNAFPQVFPAESFTVEKLVSAAAFADARTVTLPMGGGAVLLPVERPLGQGIAPTVRVLELGAAVVLVSNASLAAGTELSCGQVGPWPGAV